MLPGTGQSRGVLVVSLDKRSTIETGDKKHNTLIKPKTAVHDAAIQLSPGQTIVFSGRFFHAKGDCITERRPALREAMTKPNWIMRFSAIKPAENAVSPVAERAEDTAPPAGKPAENAAPPAAERAENAAPPAATMQLGADLYEEDPKPTGKLYLGSVDWHAEQIAGAAGKPPDLAARADIEIPELKLKVLLSIRHNGDATLPTSPRLEIHFIVPSDFAHQGINSIPGVLMSGVIPLALSAVKVTDNSFEFDLGRLGLDRNLQLLKECTWLYVPLVYNDGSRAILSVEKDRRASAPSETRTLSKGKDKKIEWKQ